MTQVKITRYLLRTIIMPRSTLVLLTATLVVSVLSLFSGAGDVTPVALLAGDAAHVGLFLDSRLPRLLAVLCTGAGMSIAGLIMQQLCANKFVSPTTGATIQSAQLGILLALLFMPASTIWDRALFAFAAAMAGTWLFVAFVLRMQAKDVMLVPLIGIMFGNVVMGVTGFLAHRFDMTQAMASWTVGHFSMVMQGRYELVWLAVPLIALAFVFARHFNIVGMGRDFSRGLGLSYERILFMGLSIAAMITAAVVTVVGSISYIGLIIPNLVSLFKGDDLRGTLADTALAGALFVLLCDLAARTVVAPFELPIELIVGIVGSAVFIALILHRLRCGRRALTLANVKSLFTSGGRSASTPGAR